jgi:hypothetical protein
MGRGSGSPGRRDGFALGLGEERVPAWVKENGVNWRWDEKRFTRWELWRGRASFWRVNH